MDNKLKYLEQKIEEINKLIRQFPFTSSRTPRPNSVVISDNDATINEWLGEHANSHKHGGTDEVAQLLPAAYAIPKANASANLNDWITTGLGIGDMLKSTYDTNNDGVVDRATIADSASAVNWNDVSNKPGTYPPTKHDHKNDAGGGTLDHGLALTGLDDDDHTQYLNTTRHDTTTRHTLGTVVPHDSHGSLSNLSADNHTQYLNTTRHDTTTRHTLGTVVPHDTLEAVRYVNNQISGNIDFNKYKAIAMACDNGATLPTTPATGQWFLHTPSGRKVLMQYTGSAWQPIINYGVTVLYVDGTNGTDSPDKGYGGGANAFKTIQYAINQIPGLYTEYIYIEVAAGNYASFIIRGKFPTDNYSIYIEGSFQTDATCNITSGTVGANENHATITVSGAGWTNDQWVGYLAYYNGERRVIRTNTADTLTLVGRASATPAGTLLIQSQATVINSGTQCIVYSPNTIIQNIFFNEVSLRFMGNYCYGSSLRYSKLLHSSSTALSIEDGAYINCYYDYIYFNSSSGYFIVIITDSILKTVYGTYIHNTGAKALIGIRIDNSYFNVYGGQFVINNFNTGIDALNNSLVNCQATLKNLILNCTTGISIASGSQLATDSSNYYSGCTTDKTVSPVLLRSSSGLQQDISGLGILLNGTSLAVGATGLSLNVANANIWSAIQTFTDNTITRNILPQVTDAYDLGSSSLLWRKGWLSELDAVLFAQNTITLLGGWLMISKDEGTIPLSVAAANTTIDFGKAMTPNDYVVFRAALQVEYIKVGSKVSGTIYNVTRDLDGSGANNWAAGTPFMVLGQSGAGRIELNSYDTPRIQLLKQGANYNNTTEIIRIGDLNGNWGYGAQKWGIGLGEYVSDKANIILDEDGVLKIRNYNVDVIALSGTEARIDNVLKMKGADAAISIGATPPTSSSAGTGMWLDRTGLYGLNTDVRQVWIDNTTGKLYAGNGKIIADITGLHLTTAAELIRIGNLNGNWGYAADKWGIGLGQYTADKPNIILDEDGNLKIRNYNVDVITLSGTEARIDNVLKMYGANSAISIGATPPTSSSAGTGIWIDKTGLYSLNANNKQVWIDATTGKLYAGNGHVSLDSNGIKLYNTSSLYDDGAILWGIGNAMINGYCDDQGYYPGIKMFTYSYLDSNSSEINLLNAFSASGNPLDTTPINQLQLSGGSSLLYGLTDITFTNDMAYNCYIRLKDDGIYFKNRDDRLYIDDRRHSFIGGDGIQYLRPLCWELLMALWFFERGYDNGTVYNGYDASHNKRHLTCASYDSFHYKSAPGYLIYYWLNGSSNYFYRTNDGGLNTNNWFQFGAWVYLDNVTQNHGIIRSGVATEAWYINYVKPAGDGYFEFGYYDSGGTLRTQITTCTTAGWHFVGWMYGWTSSSSYSIQNCVDGTWSANAASAPLQMRTPSGNLEIGRGHSTYYLKGGLATAFITTLAPNEITEYYWSTKPLFI